MQALLKSLLLSLSSIQMIVLYETKYSYRLMPNYSIPKRAAQVPFHADSSYTIPIQIVPYAPL
jgi:hypothetical protein